MSANAYANDFHDPYSAPVLDYNKYNYNNQYTDTLTGNVMEPHDAVSFGDKISDWLGITHYHQDYDKYLSDKDKAYERAATQSARAWDEWFDSTSVQRRVADIEKAGLNPWLAIQSGLNISGNSSTAGSGSSARSVHSSKKDSNKLSQIAMAVMATAKLIAVLG